MMNYEEELKERLANNLINYRKLHQLTQIELAQKLNYSDKSISKWERKEGLPDLVILVKIADLYGVTVNDLLAEEGKQVLPRKRISHLMISLIAFMGVWVLATFLYMILGLLNMNHFPSWMVFIYAIPVSAIVLVVFSELWGSLLLKLAMVSFLLWSIVLSIYLSFQTVKLWLIFVLAVPVQVIFILWHILKKTK